MKTGWDDFYIRRRLPITRGWLLELYYRNLDRHETRFLTDPGLDLDAAIIKAMSR